MTVISEGKILEAARLLHEAARPAKVILFGSYARGDADEDSDLDFIVIEPEVENAGIEMVRLHKALRPIRVPADVLVYSEAEAEKRRNWSTSPLYWAFREGRLMHDSADK